MIKKPQNLRVDHFAIPCDPALALSVAKDMFVRLGFDPMWYRERIGDEDTAMETVVVQRDAVKFALMRGIDGSVCSQVNEYWRRFGFSPQHIAIACDDIRALVTEWQGAGVRFLTSENGQPYILAAEEEGGGTVLQAFTGPLWGGMFLELKEVIRSGEGVVREEFRDQNVKGLWACIRRALREGWLFRVNIFGEEVVTPTRDYQI